jgi:hypothetical protein
MRQRIGLSLAALVLGGGMVAAPGAARATSVDTLQRQLKTAVCLNDWSAAIDHSSALIAIPRLTTTARHHLVDFRHQLQEYRRRRMVFNAIPNCEAQLAQYLTTVPTPRPPLLLDRALYSVFGLGEPDLTPDQRAQQNFAHRQAGLQEIHPTPWPQLSPALLMDTTLGSAVSAGAVGQGVEVFAFVGGQGDRITIDLNVTRVLPGLAYTDDDSQLYLFNDQGYLIAANDDFVGLRSRLANVSLPTSGLYYLAVTTYNNTPILSPNRQIEGWTNDGGSAIEYTVTVTGLTPSRQLALPTPAHHQSARDAVTEQRPALR